MADEEQKLTKEQEATIAQAKEDEDKRNAEIDKEVNEEMIQALHAGWVTNGFRLHNPDNTEEAITILFFPEEQAAITRAALEVIQARKK